MMDDERKWLESQINSLRIQNEKYNDDARADRDTLNENKFEEFIKHNKRINKWITVP